MLIPTEIRTALLAQASAHRATPGWMSRLMERNPDHVHTSDEGLPVPDWNSVVGQAIMRLPRAVKNEIYQDGGEADVLIDEMYAASKRAVVAQLRAAGIVCNIPGYELPVETHAAVAQVIVSLANETSAPVESGEFSGTEILAHAEEILAGSEPNSEIVAAATALDAHPVAIAMDAAIQATQEEDGKTVFRGNVGGAFSRMLEVAPRVITGHAPSHTRRDRELSERCAVVREALTLRAERLIGNLPLRGIEYRASDMLVQLAGEWGQGRADAEAGRISESRTARYCAGWNETQARWGCAQRVAPASTTEATGT